MRWLGDRTLAHLRDVARDGAVDRSQRYELAEEIGRGGMGVVFRAFDRELEREVAVKVLNPEASGLVERLRQEARILGRLEHPGIVPIHDIGHLADGRLFYVMKLVRGERLDRYAAASRPLPDRLRIVDRLCDAVAFAHAHGVIHRDLKPENIMVGSFGEVLVLDWGVARIRREQPAAAGSARSPGVTQHGTVLGTPGYMAPEQEAGSDVDERADVFAIGSILAYLVSEPEPALRAIIARARHADRGLRYGSVSELADEVKRYAAGAPVHAYRESVVERASRVVRRYRVPIVLVGAYLLMRIVLLLVAGI